MAHTHQERREQELQHERKTRQFVPDGHKWFKGWTNWFDTPPPANTPVEYMCTDGRRFGVKSFEDPANSWYPPIARWWWRIPPVGLYYNPLSMALDTFIRVRADLGTHEATEVWEEVHRSYRWDYQPLPRESALARIQTGELEIL